MKLHLQPKGGGKHLLCKVVAGRSESSGGYDDVRTGLCDIDRLCQPFRVVANDGMVKHIYSQLREIYGNISGIGVRGVSEQQLRANGKDLRAKRFFHGIAPFK